MLRSFIASRESHCTGKELSHQKTLRPPNHNISNNIDFRRLRSQKEELSYLVCMRDLSGSYVDHVKEWIKATHPFYYARYAMKNMLQSTVTVISEGDISGHRCTAGQGQMGPYGIEE